jgi:ABC-type spermidine/putrescine transport system permease subunit I
VIERFTLHNYRKFLFDRFYLGVLGTTLRISVLVTLATLVTGYPVASYLNRPGRASARRSCSSSCRRSSSAWSSAATAG